MNLANLLAMCDESKPNQYDEKMKTQWVSEVEGMVVDEVLNMAEGNEIEFKGYDYDTDSERVLLVPDRYADVYLNYLYAKIDFQNAEYGRFNNSMAMFEASYQTYKAYYRSRHMPKQRARLSAIGR